MGAMTLSAGDFKNRVVFKQPTTTTNNEGGEEKSYTIAFTTWAAEKKWDQVRANELGQPDLVNTKVIYIRYAAVRAVIDENWRVNMDGKDYVIHGKPTIQESGLKVFEITCKAK